MSQTNRVVTIPATTVALLRHTAATLERKSSDGGIPAGGTQETALTGLERKSVPRWLPNGNPIETLGELGGVLCVDEKTAAFMVVQSHNPPLGLLVKSQQLLQAAVKDVYSADRTSDEDQGDGAVPVPFETLKPARRRTIKHRAFRQQAKQE